MEPLSSLSLFHEPTTALDAINVAKVLTGIVIFYLGGTYGFTPRSTMYTGIHVSYLSWWLLEQTLFPPFNSRFQEPVDGATWVVLLLMAGLFYSLPAYNAFRNRHAVPYTVVSIVSIILFSLGCLINTMADVQMHTTKGLRKGLVTEGIFRLAQNPNYLGDYMRYGSFCLLSGHASSFLVLAIVVSINYLSTQDPSQKGGMLDRYGMAYTEWVEQVPNKIMLNLDSNTCMIITGILALWATSFALGKYLRGKKFHVEKSEMA